MMPRTQSSSARSVVVGLLFVYFCAFSWPISSRADTFSFDDIELWVGSGANRAAMVIDWVESSAEPPALAWGYRWDGSATGRDMLLAIVAADERLFVKLGDEPVNPILVYGIGYDADDDGEFGVDDGTSFDDDGVAFGGAPFFAAAATDPVDYYAEGWTFAFWHYGIAASNPYDGGVWEDIQFGMAGRQLADGAWDSWAFETPAEPPFTAYAENPQAAAPFPPGDYDRDGDVDMADYARWKELYGTADPAADGNGDGAVNAADYTVWRNHAGAGSASANHSLGIPEPRSDTLAILALSVWAVAATRRNHLAVGVSPRNRVTRAREAAQRRHWSRVAAARLPNRNSIIFSVGLRPRLSSLAAARLVCKKRSIMTPI